jgi:histidyl-tRNA synthetase
MGLDRLVMVLPEAQSAEWVWKPELFLAFMGEPAFRKALEITRSLRHQGHSCYIDFSGGSLKSQMRLANKLRAEHVLIIGENELARDKYSIKKLDDSQQWDITIQELSDYLKTRGRKS